MSRGEWITRATIWLALGCYFVAEAIRLRSPRAEGWRRAARGCWTLGCAAYLAHVVAAFGSYHGWSHAAAYRDTARQTKELFGWDWGGGLFANYFFTFCWVVDVADWWRRGLEGRALRPRWLSMLWHGFLFFMVFNATVVFGHGPARWLGIAGCGVLVFFFLAAQKRNRMA